MNDKRIRAWMCGCLRSAMALLIVGSLWGCAAERPWAIGNLQSFEQAYDDSLVVRTTDLPAAVVGKEYEFTLQARGEPGPFRWKLVSGPLPGGLALGEDGAIRGTPTAPEAAKFVVKVSSRTPPRYSAFGSSPHIGWRMRQFTLVVKNADLSSSARPTKTATTVRP